MMRRARGSALGEQLIMLALLAFYIGVVVALYLNNPAHAYIMIGMSVAAVVLIFITGILRDRRKARMEAERRRLDATK